jgi:hypothetical protein
MNFLKVNDAPAKLGSLMKSVALPELNAMLQSTTPVEVPFLVCENPVLAMNARITIAEKITLFIFIFMFA